MLVCTTACFTPGSLVTDSLTSAAMSADFTPFNAYMLQTDSIEVLEFIHDPEGEHKIILGYCSSNTTTYKELADEAAVDGFHFAADLMRLGLPAGAVGYFYVPVRCRYFGDEGAEEVFAYVQIPADPASVTVGQPFELLEDVPEDVCAISPGPEPGESDFKFAKVTINPTVDPGVTVSNYYLSECTIFYPENATSLYYCYAVPVTDNIAEIILYKNNAIMTAINVEFPDSSFIPITTDAISCSGNAAIEGEPGDEYITITGDCTLSFTVSDK